MVLTSSLFELLDLTKQLLSVDQVFFSLDRVMRSSDGQIEELLCLLEKTQSQVELKAVVLRIHLDELRSQLLGLFVI